MAINAVITMPHADPGKRLSVKVCTVGAGGMPNTGAPVSESFVGRDGDSASLVVHSGQVLILSEVDVPAAAEAA